MTSFNNLSDKTSELLNMLSEEASEVIQIKEKIMRHGLFSYHPKNPNNSNKELLEKEIGDFLGIMDRLIIDGIISEHLVSAYRRQKWLKALRYTHYQEK